jgi:sigma-B regulation protein RsbU (phosphoserine phosphatase)
MKTAKLIQKDNSSLSSRNVASGGKPAAAAAFDIHMDVSKLMCDAEANCYLGAAAQAKAGDLVNVGQHLKEHRRMRRSLVLAKEVQQNLLPKSRPKLKSLDIAGKSVYCDEIGGDYFDYHDFSQAGHEKLGVVIGDVSGHGISAALLMATVRAALRQRVSLPGSIKDMISDVNRQLADDVEESGQFIGLFYLVVDAQWRALKWVRAGHSPAILYDPDTDSFEQLNGSGVALGVDKNVRYAEKEKRSLKKGHLIILATDGLWEARNPKGQMFGRSAMISVIRQNKFAGAKQILEALFDQQTRFREDAQIEDDITAVVVKMGN